MGTMREKLLPVFLSEAATNLANIAQCLNDMGDSGLGDRASLESGFRSAHSIKGTAALIKLPIISAIAMRLEDTLEELMESGRRAGTGEIRALRFAFDQLARMIDGVAMGGEESPAALDEVNRYFLTPQADTEEGHAPSPAEEEEEREEEDTPPVPVRAVIVCCRFQVGGREFHLPIENMVEISGIPALTFLPRAPGYVRGLANLRGEVLPIIDLGQIKGFPSNFTLGWHLIIASYRGEKLAFLAEGIPSLSPEPGGERLNVEEFIRQYAMVAN